MIHPDHDFIEMLVVEVRGMRVLRRAQDDLSRVACRHSAGRYMHMYMYM